jgi:CheY-like chemotaxis protein
MSTILVLEDEPINMSVIRGMLQSQHSILEATTGKHAIELCIEHPSVDLLIADVMIRDYSGIRVATEIREAYPAMKFLFMSGTPIEGWGREDRRLYNMLPAERVDFLQKPFRNTDLKERIQRLVGSQPSR